MNKKGQIGVGVLIVVFVGAIVALTLYLATEQEIGKVSVEFEAVNTSYTAPAAGSSIDLEGQELLSTPVVINCTDEVVLNSGNYTITEAVGDSGVKSIVYTTSTGSLSASECVNVSYEYGPDGYLDGSNRTIADLIPIVAALALIVFVLVKSGVIESVNRLK